VQGIAARGLKTEAQKEFEVRYFEKRVGLYRLDVLVEAQIIHRTESRA
jgi:hypothetical protein